MAYLSYPSPEEVQLRLDAYENAILTVVRHCRWTEAEVQGRLPGSSLAATVILTAERARDTTIREILLRSFQLVFPPDGGEGAQVEPKVATKALRSIR